MLFFMLVVLAVLAFGFRMWVVLADMKAEREAELVKKNLRRAVRAAERRSLNNLYV